MLQSPLAASGTVAVLPHALLLLGAAGALGYLGWQSLVLRIRGVRATGVCVKHTYRERGIRVVVRFSTPAGGTHTCLGSPSPVAGARIGADVEVVYDPRKPDNAEVPPISVGTGFSLLTIASLVAVAGVWLLVWIAFF
ncbi:DUF3592 domain-containing protein [Streptomyces griseus]|uniref:DUF3592 domain-containing protein n=1 Tax=Streptomyces griseus TaxID=1911 RepID=UPI00084070E3|nr:DUF3592 domain-containing protein [Streptomyces griseus]